jgi:SAM-dependent methyltransferase
MGVQDAEAEGCVTDDVWQGVEDNDGWRRAEDEVDVEIGEPYVEWELEYNAYMTDVLRAALARLNLANTRRGIDAGCGPGGVWPLMVEAMGPDGAIVALDGSKAHRREARRRRADLGLDGRVAVLAHDLARPLPEGPPFDAPCDWVWLADVLYSPPFVDPGAVVRHLARAVRPGGVVAVFEGGWLRDRLLPGYSRLEHYLHLAHQALTFGDHWPPYSSRSQHWERAPEWLMQAGLTAITVSSHSIAHYEPPKGGPIYTYLEQRAFHQLRQPAARRLALGAGLREAEWDEWMEISEPESPEYILAQPGYYCTLIGTLAVGVV